MALLQITYITLFSSFTVLNNNFLLANSLLHLVVRYIFTLVIIVQQT